MTIIVLKNIKIAPITRLDKCVFAGVYIYVNDCVDTLGRNEVSGRYFYIS